MNNSKMEYEHSPTVSAIGQLSPPPLEPSALPPTFESLFPSPPVTQDRSVDDAWTQYIDMSNVEPAADSDLDMGRCTNLGISADNDQELFNLGDIQELYQLLITNAESSSMLSPIESTQSEPSTYFHDIMQPDINPSTTSFTAPATSPALEQLVEGRPQYDRQHDDFQERQDDVQHVDLDERKEGRRDERSSESTCSPPSSCGGASSPEVYFEHPQRELRVRPAVQPAVSVEDGLLCPVEGCGTRVTNSTDLRRHRESIHENKVQCIICDGFLTARKDAMTRHWRSTLKCLKIQVQRDDDSISITGLPTREEAEIYIQQLALEKRKKATEYKGQRKRRRL